MSFYRVLNNSREISIASMARYMGLRDSCLARARIDKSLRKILVKEARLCNHEALRYLRYVRNNS